ncbi:GNAT family N-acetyltransferase [Paenibacillus antibioticophila]|uniref:GNAT family N-acetyltransferase n=1 Tax=Paenibacillus antibioticophila TaxID=1274374 RepID=UPI0005CA40FE|nr:GNAT family protein [Paenibacillus antibioticophila]
MNLFQGNRVKLTALTEQDAEIYADWSNDSEYLRNLDTDYARPRSAEGYKSDIQATISDLTQMEFGIRQIDNHKLIGFAALNGIEWNNRAAHLAIGIGEKEYRSKGYGTEAIRLLLRYAFHELNLNRVGLDVNDNNTAAIRAYEKCGFTVEGRMREGILRDGVKIDRIYMGLLYREWIALSKNE